MDAHLHLACLRHRLGHVDDVQDLRRPEAVVAKRAHRRVVSQWRSSACRRRSASGITASVSSCVAARITGGATSASKRLAPGRGAHAPAIAGNEAGKAELRHGRDQVVALRRARSREIRPSPARTRRAGRHPRGLCCSNRRGRSRCAGRSSTGRACRRARSCLQRAWEVGAGVGHRVQRTMIARCVGAGEPPARHSLALRCHRQRPLARRFVGARRAQHQRIGVHRADDLQ